MFYVDSDLFFDCSKENYPCCKSSGKHDHSTMKTYEAKSNDDNQFHKVRFCDDHFHNHKKYGWIDVRPESNSCVIKIEIKDGYHCKSCNEYCQFSAPNQDDGTFICYGCRSR